MSFDIHILLIDFLRNNIESVIPKQTTFQSLNYPKKEKTQHCNDSQLFFIIYFYQYNFLIIRYFDYSWVNIFEKKAWNQIIALLCLIFNFCVIFKYYLDNRGSNG
jgi:hypothetical protein